MSVMFIPLTEEEKEVQLAMEAFDITKYTAINQLSNYPNLTPTWAASEVGYAFKAAFELGYKAGKAACKQST